MFEIPGTPPTLSGVIQISAKQRTGGMNCSGEAAAIALRTLRTRATPVFNAALISGGIVFQVHGFPFRN